MMKSRLSSRIAIITVMSSFSVGVDGYNGGKVSVNKECYEYDEEIIISFEIDDPGTDDWIGIYPADNVTGDWEPLMWVRKIGSVVRYLLSSFRLMGYHHYSSLYLLFFSALVLWHTKMLGENRLGCLYFWKWCSERRLHE
jgi:hypothetical protein